MSWVEELDKRLSEIEERQTALAKELKTLREAVKQLKGQAGKVAPHVHQEYADAKLGAKLLGEQEKLKARLDDIKSELEEKLELVMDDFQYQIFNLGESVEKLEARQEKQSEEFKRLLELLARRGLIKLAAKRR